MKVAAIGSRNLNADIAEYAPENVTLIISGGARGVDSEAERYADAHGIEKLIFLPDYGTHEKNAPFIRNRQIARAADIVIAIWDGKSRGTKYTADYARLIGKEVRIFIVKG